MKPFFQSGCRLAVSLTSKLVFIVLNYSADNAENNLLFITSVCVSNMEEQYQYIQLEYDKRKSESTTWNRAIFLLSQCFLMWFFIIVPHLLRFLWNCSGLYCYFAVESCEESFEISFKSLNIVWWGYINNANQKL